MNPADSRISVQGLAPLLQVFDMPASFRFYRDLLGFSLVQAAPSEAAPDWALLELDGVQVMLNTAYEAPHRPSAPDAARIAAHADTTIYFGCPDVEAAYARLKAKGAVVTPPAITGYGFKALSLVDPDGYGLCFHWPVKA